MAGRTRSAIKEAAMNRLPLRLAAVGLLAWAGAAWADDPSFTGRWRWNRAESTVAPGEALPKDIITEIASADRARVRWSVTITDSRDAKHTQSFDGPPDGQPHPVDGSIHGETAAFTLAGNAMKAVFKNPAGESDTVTCTLSNDLRKMTCRGTVVEAKGRSSNYIDVYDRL
jgi:hypothetical protein